MGDLGRTGRATVLVTQAILCLIQPRPPAALAPADTPPPVIRLQYPEHFAELPELNGLDVTPSQRIKIDAIIADARAAIRRAKAEIPGQRWQIHRKYGTEAAAPSDIAGVLKRSIQITILMARRDADQILTDAQRTAAAAARAKLQRITEVTGFETVKARQETPQWCWAAVVQMLLNHAGVRWSQEQVVQEIKNGIVAETATPAEIVKGVRGWRFDAKAAGRSWRADANYHDGVPPGDIIVRLLDIERLAIVGIKDQHLAVIIRAKCTESLIPELLEVTLYDPLDGTERTIPWKEASREITQWWEAWAALSSTSTF